MCGIAGFITPGRFNADPMRAEALRMAGALAHRGPDDQGVWLDAQYGIGLAHRRLSIIDLSPMGHQPMSSASGRYIVTYNGEIYNYRELRAELSALGHAFKGASDTEVLLAAVEQWGVEAALQRFTGMFALALWDRDERLTYLARDRFGEKPLYYGRFGQHFGFASELKALQAHSAWSAEISRDALAQLLRYGFIPAPYSIFRDIRKLRPGYFLRIRRMDGSFSTEERAYWNVHQFVQQCSTASLSSPEAVEVVEDALTQAIRRQMIADVPLGAFLSGGIDSSLVVALMQRQSAMAIKTFSIGFWEETFNEAPFARAIAEHLGTDHTELIVTPGDALAVIPDLPRMYDEPLADSSQIPTYLVSRLARRSVTVSLSGDGGDELFGGYTRYGEALNRTRSLSRVPAGLRQLAAQATLRLPRTGLELASWPTRLARRFRNRTDLPERLRERAAFWRAGSAAELYHAQISQWQQPSAVVLGSNEPAIDILEPGFAPPGLEPASHMMYTDMLNYLPNDILVKVDRAAMAVSLETRIPLLDPEVAKAAWRTPAAVHWHDGRGKWVLRQTLERYVPRTLFERPKMGFAVPVAHWLRKELKPWAAALLDPVKLHRDGFFDHAEITRRWNQHQTGATDWSFHLWSVLIFQAWLEDQTTARARSHSIAAQGGAA